MTVTVLDRTWELEIWPASRSQAPNAVYITVRHRPRPYETNLLPGSIRFGLTEAEVNRIAHALIETVTRNRGTEIVRTLRENAERALVEPKLRASAPEATSEAAGTRQPQFTKTQGKYLAFIHRYISRFGQAPSEADIQDRFLVSAPSVNAMMQTLTRKGLISRVPGVPRSIELLVPPDLLPED